MTDKDLTSVAADKGLEKFLSRFPDELVGARTAARQLGAQVPVDFDLAEEPAHVFRCPDETRP